MIVPFNVLMCMAAGVSDIFCITEMKYKTVETRCWLTKSGCSHLVRRCQDDIDKRVRMFPSFLHAVFHFFIHSSVTEIRTNFIKSDYPRYFVDNTIKSFQDRLLTYSKREDESRSGYRFAKETRKQVPHL